MNSSNSRRGLQAIFDQDDCRNALAEMDALLERRHSLTTDELDYLDKLNLVVSDYLGCCPDGDTKADPYRLLVHLIEKAELTTAIVAERTGIPDLSELVMTTRRFTADDAAKLGAYFKRSPSCFIDAN